VAQTLFADQALARDFKLGPVVAVVDAADAGGRAAAAPIARAQIAAADVVVLSKTDRVADSSETRSEIRHINPQAPVIEARFGDIDPSLLKSGTDHVFSPAAAHPAGIRTFALRFDSPVKRELLERFLALLVELRGADLLRVKGVVALQGGEAVLVQGVRHVFDRLRPVELSATGLVFITHGVTREDVEALWGAISRLGS
jgi:G3E family GTPase